MVVGPLATPVAPKEHDTHQKSQVFQQERQKMQHTYPVHPARLGVVRLWALEKGRVFCVVAGDEVGRVVAQAVVQQGVSSCVAVPPFRRNKD
eukprot:10594218-Ditylum_brightwellii.AAC.1